MCSDYLNQALMANEAMTGLTLKKDWAKPYLNPEEQISLAYQQSNWVLDQRETHA